MIKAVMIVEMAGRPAEHLTETLEKHMKVLYKLKDVEVHSIEVSEPREIEQEGEEKKDPMFTAFSEAEFSCETFERLSEIMFDFMPSSIEVLEPSKVSLNLSEANSLLNNISGRMHHYDQTVRTLLTRHKKVIDVAKKMKEELVEAEKPIEKKKSKKKG